MSAETENRDKRIKELEEENQKLKKEVDHLKKVEKEFQEFKAKHTVTVENLRRAMNIKPNSKKKPKPLGAPIGHKAYTRHIPERIDRIKVLNPKRCPTCNTKLKKEPTEIRTRYVTDIKLVSKAKTTKYGIYRKYCPTCDKIVELPVPNALPYAKLGLNLMLFIMYLKLGLRLPGGKIKDFLLTCYNIGISEGGIVGVLRQLAREFGDYYAHLEKIVKLARVKHTDSTSWRIDGKNYFAWVFIACGVALYKIRKRNNSRVPLTVFGRNQKGNTLVIDRHSALRALAKKAGFLLQYCWSHILDDSKKLAKGFGAEGRYVHKKLKEIYVLAKGLGDKGTLEHVEQLKGEIFQLTLRHYRHLTVWRFVRNLYDRDVESLFRFVTDPDVDSTNNISERELRELVLIRNISHGSRSPRGANATAMLLSVVQTLRLNKQNVLEGLKDILNNPSRC
ncbi:MAG: IS66 family transposase [Nanoarchaeota archaeon]|nr:IS66 family transposase [Nanoarchaeota archaeon]